MREWCRRHWRELKQGEPGSRFERLYHRRQEKRRRAWEKPVLLILAAVMVAAGVVMLVVPGPGLLALLVGAAMIAHESLLGARALDWAELKLRPPYERCRSLCRRASQRVKAAARAAWYVRA
jgi:hypothetical protein